MRPSTAIMALLCGVSCFGTISPARAQAPVQTSYYSNLQANTTVSPFLNLGVTPNGITNYQTLVRPLLNEREALMQQSMNMPKLRGPAREVASTGIAGGTPTDDPKSRNAGKRFMNYSHYFSKAR